MRLNLDIFDTSKKTGRFACEIMADVPECWESPIDWADAVLCSMHAYAIMFSLAHLEDDSLTARALGVPLYRVREMKQRTSIRPTRSLRGGLGEMVLKEMYVRAGIPLSQIHSCRNKRSRDYDVDLDLLLCPLETDRRLNTGPFKARGKHVKMSTRERYRQASHDSQHISGQVRVPRVIGSLTELEYVVDSLSRGSTQLNLSPEAAVQLHAILNNLLAASRGGQNLNVQPLVVDYLIDTFNLRVDLKSEHISQELIIWRENPHTQTAAQAAQTAREKAKPTLDAFSLVDKDRMRASLHCDLETLGHSLQNISAVDQEPPPELAILPEVPWVIGPDKKKREDDDSIPNLKKKGLFRDIG